MQQASTYVNSVEPKEIQKKKDKNSVFCLRNVLRTSPMVLFWSRRPGP